MGERLADSPFAGVPRHQDHAEARLVSRLSDLAAAYRQLARASGHALLALWTLVFGASASVVAFNWTAAGLGEILVHLLGPPTFTTTSMW